MNWMFMLLPLRYSAEGNSSELRRLELFGRNCLALVVREFGGVGEGEEQRLAGKAEEKTGGRRVWAARR